MSALRVAVVGGGWAGMAAAVSAVQAGHAVTVWEASRQWGGRARAVPHEGDDSSHGLLDNGQHILIGAYTDTLRLMRLVGVDPDTVLHRMPLCMQYPDGSGMRLPDWPAPLDVLAGVLSAKGWALADKLSMLRTTGRWQRNRFVCDSTATVGDLCPGLSPKVMQTLIEPLCVSALNTPTHQASGQVFLRVLKDSLSGASGSSNLLIPKTDLTALFPLPAANWLTSKGAGLRSGHRVHTLQRQKQWLVNGEAFDAVILATTPAAANQLIKPLTLTPEARPGLLQWIACAGQLRYEAITTVYLQAPGARLPMPLLALHSDAYNPAQFVFDRGQIGGPAGLLAFVISASTGGREHLQQQVLHQARNQLAALFDTAALKPTQTIVEKRATFACTPGLERPSLTIAPGLLACGDYVEGPYPATLEGAVRSGITAAQALTAT